MNGFMPNAFSFILLTKDGSKIISWKDLNIFKALEIDMEELHLGCHLWGCTESDTTEAT